MSKVSGSYESVVLGVSEQVPQDRRSGQHFEQVNMISDPVKGLARRHGSVMRDEVILADYTSPLYTGAVADTATHKEFTFFVGGVEYALFYRVRAQAAEELQDFSFAWCVNKDTKQFVTVVRDAGDTVMDSLVSGGVSAIVNTGKYIYLAGNTIVPTYDAEDRFGVEANKNRLVAWVRGGAFSRTFSITLTKADGTTVVGEYKTKPAAYPELLDTSDILTADPDYEKLVNDRTNAYNSAVTAYIGEAAEDITPQNIADKLRDDLVLAGVTCDVVGSTIVIDDEDYVEISGDDGGDNTLLRAVGNEISAPDLVSVVHYVGKVVKVKPKKTGGEDAFYLEAIPKNAASTGWTEVTWRETAGYVMTPETVFIQGTVVDETLYLASSPALLTGLAGGTHPEFKPNSVGDDVTSPLPTFFGKRIDYLGMFQDRLVIGYGATLLHSRPGDYFNWFRRSVLTVEDTDAFEMYALGSEDDTIRSSTTYDRNVLYFGDRFQYTVNGRSKLVPQTASMPIVSAHKDANAANPQSSSNFVFYGQSNNNIASLHQVQTGVIAESPESYEISQQLESYLRGTPVQIVPMTAPNLILLRTDVVRQGFYTYSYLDTPAGAERIFDAWSRWEWDESLGPIAGVTVKNGSILVLTLRRGEDSTGQDSIYAVLDEFSTSTGLSARPYLDSLRLASDEAGWLNDNTIAPAAVAFENASVYRFLGEAYENRGAFIASYELGDAAAIWAGVDYPAYVVPTNPYIRDQNDKAIISGRLTLGKLSVSVSNTGGMLGMLETLQGGGTVLNFNGRILGQVANMVGRQPIVTTSISVPVGKEVRECKYTLKAKTWLPLTITAIEWTGQSFNNSRRA
jgi:hypothetical protein